MTQPSGQLLVDGTNPLSGLFFYAQGSNGLWDANNGALLTKTGTAGMAVEAGVNVVIGNAATHYSLAASQTLTAPFTLRSRPRKAVGTTTNSMACGDMASTNHFVWLDSGTGRLRLRCKYSGAASYAEVNSTNPVDTTSPSIISITVEANGAWAMYQDDALIDSGSMSGTGTPQFILSAICGGYSGGSFRLNGALEFLHAIPGHAATAGEIAALNADPYSVLVVTGTDGTAEAGTGTGTGSGSGADATGDALAETGTGTGSGSGSGDDATGGSNSIVITSPADYQPHQRNDLNTADIAISVTWTGTPLAIESRFNGGSWSTIIAAPAGGAGSGVLANCPFGQGALEVRFVNDPAVTASKSYITVGDIYVATGQSNPAGRATQKIDPVATNWLPVKYGRDGVWKPLTESTTQAGSFDEGASAAGSFFGQLSNLLQSNGVPVAFIPAAIGSTSAAAWQPPTPHTNTSFAYGIALTRVLAACGGDFRAWLWWQGESDTATDQATYQAQTHNIIDTFYSDTGKPTFMVKICQWNASAIQVRSSQDAIIASNTHIVGSAEANVWSSGNVHYDSVAEIQDVAAAIYAGMVSAFYAQADSVAEAGTGTGVGSGFGEDATGDALAETGVGTGTGSGSGDDATGGSLGDAVAETGTGTGVGSGSGEDATGDALSETGTGTGVGSGTGADPGGESIAYHLIASDIRHTTIIHQALPGVRGYLPGEVAELPMSVLDRDGLAADPGAIVLKIKPPIGPVVSYVYGSAAEVIRDATGRYHADLMLSRAGQWAYRWELGAPNAGAAEGVITVLKSRVI